MTRIVRFLLLALIVANWSLAAEAAGYIYIRGIDGESGDSFANDLVPNPEETYEQLRFVKSWSTSGDADDRPTEAVAFQLTFGDGQSPTLSSGGTWEIDAMLTFNYSIDLRRGTDPFETHIGTGTARVAGSALGGVETRVFNMEILSLDFSGVINGITPFMVRESPTVASTGHTAIERLAGGQFRINSFFLVFTEMSIDGGQTWAEMVPEPCALSLALLAAVGLAFVGRERRARS